MSVSVGAPVADLVAPLDALAVRAAERAAAGYLVVVAGPSGCGRTSVLARVGQLHDGPVLAGGGLAGLRAVPALALSRALRVPVPTGDTVAAAEFLRAAAGRGTLLLLDDLHLADAVTVEIVALLAGQLPIMVGIANDTLSGVTLVENLRTLPGVVVESVPALAPDEARAVLRATNPDLDHDSRRVAIAAAGGNPGALVALAADPLASDLRVAVAHRLLAAGSEARTALSLVGLLGRVAGTDLIGPALVRSAAAAGLVVVDGNEVRARSALDIDVTLRMLTDEHRRSLHRLLAVRIRDAGEQARHYEAAGDNEAANRAAHRAALAATSPRARVCHLAVAARTAPPSGRSDACLAVALTAGDCADHRLAVTLVETAGAEDDPRAALVRARAALAMGDLPGVMVLLDAATDRLGASEPGDPIAQLIALERARALCLADPIEAMGLASEVFGTALTRSIRSRAAGVLGAAQLAAGVDGWEATLESAQIEAAEGGLDDVALAAAANLCSGYLHHGDADRAFALASRSGAIARSSGATGWAAKFEAIGLWVTVQVRTALADGLTVGAALLDAALPPALRCEVATHVALAHADGGDLAAASANIAGLDPARSELLAWCDAELDALGGDARSSRTKALAVLSRARNWPVPTFATMTARWSGSGRSDLAEPAQIGGSAFELAALDERSSDPARAAPLFHDAAQQWVGFSGRSAWRCRVAAASASAEVDPWRALPELRLLAGELERLGLASLGVQVTRMRRRLGDPELPATGTGHRGTVLSRREREVLAAVADGATSAAIAVRLGVAPSTVETHVKSAMRKLGAATRTEAAVRAARLAKP